MIFAVATTHIDQTIVSIAAPAARQGRAPVLAGLALGPEGISDGNLQHCRGSGNRGPGGHVNSAAPASTGYYPVRDAVSDYGVGPYRGWFWLQAVAGGVGCLALGIALARLHPFTPTQVVVALIVTAGSRFLIPFFATDQHGGRFQTLHGTIHMILAVIAFGGLVWAATGLWPTLSHYPAWHGTESALTIIPWIILGCVVAVVLAIGAHG